MSDIKISETIRGDHKPDEGDLEGWTESTHKTGDLRESCWELGGKGQKRKRFHASPFCTQIGVYSSEFLLSLSLYKNFDLVSCQT